MAYPELPPLKSLSDQIECYAQRQHEYGAEGIAALLAEARGALEAVRDKLAKLPPDEMRAAQEPNDLAAIRSLRPEGRRSLIRGLPADYENRLAGAFLGRSAGCILGAGVELWSVERMKNLAREIGCPFPPVDYWEYMPDPYTVRYTMSPRFHYSRRWMHGVPVDDDIAYTVLGLLILEEYGPDFTVADVGKAWLKYLPLAYTAEEATLANLRKGIPAETAGAIDNPYCEWIGADIRSDPWGYAAPGRPEAAAALAYRDASLSHRRQGIYGEMFFAAAVSAAFAVDDPVEALRIGLEEIPRDCALAREVRWALAEAPGIRCYADARGAVDERFKGMHQVHTINNACLTIWGITIGGTDFTKVIGETVAMGLDNDCTAATAGSIVGAVVGKTGIPPRWYQPFGDYMESYLIGLPRLSISDVLGRFAAQARRLLPD